MVLGAAEAARRLLVGVYQQGWSVLGSTAAVQDKECAGRRRTS
jgi:hypothetical protein